MSAQQPKDDQEAKIIQQEGLKAQLAQSVEAQALKVRQLKADKADKTEIDKEVEALLSLKKELALLEGDKKADSGKKSTKPAKTSFTLKTAKVNNTPSPMMLLRFETGYQRLQ
ncbi:uncharacterized protein B0P05DRAFT_533080 [Gilbertella persicaria]|uniref:uncharacterized protein n=1 Tax=Gilbertella persicaria TaxID=101096 RepID=UPI002220EDB9|nr:uncharacterized protein B0P05DRAFT_533080 [Gilbertella persicaria]KAI8086957.1 hypothetical protein B0P05DRAFT_533080 [Gilbertella persicaria]